MKPKQILNYFVGIDVPGHVKEEIEHFTRNEMGELSPFVEWISALEFHMTLAYIGRITAEQRSRLIEVADQVRVPPFTIHIQGMGFHPPGKHPKSLWVGVGTGREKISVFGDRIRKDIAMKAGLVAHDRFVPHITVGKIVQRPDRKKLLGAVREFWDYPFGAFRVESIHLFRLTKNGYAHNHEVKLRAVPNLFL